MCEPLMESRISLHRKEGHTMIQMMEKLGIKLGTLLLEGMLRSYKLCQPCPPKNEDASSF